MAFWCVSNVSAHAMACFERDSSLSIAPVLYTIPGTRTPWWYCLGLIEKRCDDTPLTRKSNDWEIWLVIFSDMHGSTVRRSRRRISLARRRYLHYVSCEVVAGRSVGESQLDDRVQLYLLPWIWHTGKAQMAAEMRAAAAGN